MGIDPSTLSQLIKSLSSGVNGAQPLAASYVGQFNRYGLGTGAVSKLLADYSWAANQNPMLQRRYSLASHQPPGSWADGWTSAGAGSLAYTSTGAAKNAGTNDAKQMSAYLQAHDQAGVQKMLDAMAQNEGDSDYMAAFFSQLGPSGLYALSLLAQGGGSKDKDSENEVKTIVGDGLASASYEMTLTRSVLQGIAPANELPGTSPETLPGGWDSGALAPFLTEGEFSSQWLNVLAPTVLYQKGVEMGQQVPYGYNAIFTAIANNPDFAAGFYHQNADQLNEYMTDPILQNYLAKDQSFGKFLEAATIPPPGEADTKPFTANATALVQLFGGGSVDTTSAVRLAMASIAGNYFDDIVGTVTAAAPGAGSSMGLSASEWGWFVQNAMKDKTAAAYLLTEYADWRDPQLKAPDYLPTSGKGDDSSTPYYAGYWHDQSYGMLDYFFASNYKAAGAKAGEDSNSVLDALKEGLTAGGAALLTSVVFGPEAGAAMITMDMVEEAGKDAFQSAAESGLSSVEDGLGKVLDSKQPAPTSADGLVEDFDTVQGRWSRSANDAWLASGSSAGHVNASDFPQTWYNGVQYTGDPLTYEQQYGGNFVESDGRTIKPLDEIQQDPKALAAYNAWLQDPAIVKAIAAGNSAEGQGAVNSLYGSQMSSGGGGG